MPDNAENENVLKAAKFIKKNPRLYDALANITMLKFMVMMAALVILGGVIYFALDQLAMLPTSKTKIIYVYDNNISVEAQTLNEVFDNHYTHMLTTVAILLSLFGFGLPIVSYYYQRLSLKDEREAIQHEIDSSVANLKRRSKKIEDEYKRKMEDYEKQIQEMSSGLTVAIKNHEEKMLKHDNEISKTQNKNDFTFGYFAQQLGWLCHDVVIPRAPFYYILAAKYFSKNNIKRSIECIESAINNLKELSDKSQSNNYCDHHKTDLEMLKKNITSNKNAIKLVDELEKEIERVKKDSVKAPEGNKE